jgi:hypothetical protein
VDFVDQVIDDFVYFSHAVLLGMLFFLMLIVISLATHVQFL